MKIAIKRIVEVLRTDELISENAHTIFENSSKHESVQAHLPLTAQVMIPSHVMWILEKFSADS